MTGAWTSVVVSAVRGTDRMPWAPSADTPSALVQRASGAPGGRALLVAAATLTPWVLAGRRPRRTEGQRMPAPGTDLPLANAAAVTALARILEGAHEALLEEWCARAQRAELRAAGVHLPALLDRIPKAKGALRQALRHVVGARGRWLAAWNPDWRGLFGASEEDADDAFETGALDRRVEALENLRAHDPEAARVRLEAVWQEATTKERAAFLVVLADGLSSEDEAFLEAALDDRRAEVRRPAARLLSCLPASRFAARMKARARAALVPGVERKFLKQREVLEIHLPETLDKTMRRDGVSGRTVGGLGKRASLLVEVMRVTPLEAWHDMPPERWLSCADRTEFRRALLRGWSEAAEIQADSVWAEALLRHTGTSGKSDATDLGPDVLESALKTAGPEAREEFVSRALGESRDGGHAILLDPLDHAWSPAFSRLVLEFAVDVLTSREARDVEVVTGRLENVVPARADPALAERIRVVWAKHHGEWAPATKKAVSRAFHLLELRAVMRKELVS